ncbi:stress responsive alpha/beta barrel protein [Breznakibacter xylanolyticus]|uniref:Stress responsive alpha/beta barrel protein n=1 Tax=Breznakibacter xylanolyticus TaxID=990 RepID=A0A2W7NB49_9BACT|nr:Dabb family protein [Breznakibacter xylanolyticus]PZX17348.1 stress responsive alpha/beta barrel protein [Breznakibacter xylanolyticus]
MIKHVVLFKFKTFEGEEEKNEKLNNIKTALLDLKNKLDFLRHIEVGINANPSESFDMALITEFDNMDDLHRYAIHPDHVAVARIIGEIKENRACVDFVIG